MKNETYTDGSPSRTWYEEQGKFKRADLVPQWHPMETAPEGKDILVYCEETGEMFVVFWAMQVTTEKYNWVIARAHDGTCFICANPTHWMLLPKPPKENNL